MIPSLSKTNMFNPFQRNKSAELSEKSFGDYFIDATNEMARTGRQAENHAIQGISGQGNLVEIMTTLDEFGLIMKTFTEAHKKAIQAYRDISQMGI